MSDTSLNKIIQYGTAAERAVFTPTPASGSQVLYLWLDTDNLPTVELYVWDPDGMDWEIVASGGGGTLPDGDYGDVTVSSSGTVITIDNDAVTYAKLQNISATDRILLRDTAGAGNAEEGTATAGIEFTGAPGIGLTVAARTHTIDFSFGNGVDELTTGVKGWVRIPIAGTLTAWTLLADQSGDIVIDVWRDTLANYPPTNADSLTNGHELTLSGANAAEDTNISDWTSVAIVAGDVLMFNIDSVSDITKIQGTLTFVASGA